MSMSIYVCVYQSIDQQIDRYLSFSRSLFLSLSLYTYIYTTSASAGECHCAQDC